MNRLAAIVVALVSATTPLYAQETVLTITVPFAGIHKAPTTASPVIAPAPQGRRFAVLRNLGSWVAVPWPGTLAGVGYVHVSWGAFSRAGASDTWRTSGAPMTAPRAVMESAAADEPVPVRLAPATSPDVDTLERQPGQLTPRPVSRVLLPSHRLAVGAGLGTRSLSGLAGTGRLWFAGPFGAQLEVGRRTYTGGSVLRMNAVTVGVHAVASLSDVVTNAIWVRPYVGSGISVVRSSLRSSTGESVATDRSRGYHAFGGAEFTWANVPQLALSAEVRRSWMADPFEGFQTGGLGLALGAHWYVK